MPGLDARIRLRRGALDLAVDLRVGPGEVVALLGPNGAGKSTTLQALAGLLPPEASAGDGHVALAGRVLDSPDLRQPVPAAERGVGVVFQDYLLFPHLSVLENVAFGLRARGVRAAQAREVARSWVARVGLEAHLADRPGALSGGQAQRVALARALAPGPGLLLLDEPLAALDAGTRLQVRSELRHHLADFGGPCLVVTHDPVDAMVLADRVVVLEAGRVVQQGTPAEVARLPRTDYVARLVGLNLLTGTAIDGTAIDGAATDGTTTDGTATTGADGGTGVTLRGGAVVHVSVPAAGPVLLTFAPRAVALFDRRPEGASLRNLLPGAVTGLEPRGGTVRVVVAVGDDAAKEVGKPDEVVAEVTALAAAELHLVPGARVWVGLKATEVDVHPA